MALKQDVRTRAPRGTKTVTQAFFAALADIGDGQQAAVATAALAAIRDALKQRQAKMKAAAARVKAKAPAKAARKAPAAKRAVARRKLTRRGRKAAPPQE